LSIALNLYATPFCDKQPSRGEDAMVEKTIMPARNIVDFAHYQAGRDAAKSALPVSRLCCHCGAVLADGEREEECSSAFNIGAPPRRFYAD
jgi:hypothetical protein